MLLIPAPAPADSRNQELKVHRVAAVQREIGDAAGIDDFPNGARPRLNLRYLRLHLDPLSDLADLQGEVDAAILADLDQNIGLNGFLESGRAGPHGECADRQLDEDVISLLVGGSGPGGSRLNVGCGD